MLLNAGLVLTTIYDPVVLIDYFENFKKNDHLDQVKVFCIPDMKTPTKAYKRCAELKTKGLDIICPTIEEQEFFLNRIGFLPTLMPYNSETRRNVGYLMALESGLDFVISIDDDNYCTANEDIFESHSVVCRKRVEGEIVTSETGWYNICDLLELSNSCKAYPRGFPYYARHQNEKIESSQGVANTPINAGLWLKDPDVDAISWLVNPVYSKTFKGKSIILANNTWSPINTQNTGLNRDIIVCYYCIRMGYPLLGTPIERYGDIFSGYFTQACVRHMGGSVRFGTPIAEHRRNNHDYLNDATNEWTCIMILNDFLPWLTKEVKLQGDTYPEVYTCLSHAIEDAVENFKGKIWTDTTRGFFHQTAYHMRQWAEVCVKLSN